MRRALFDFINGVRSGIPLCCVAWYLYVSSWRGIGPVARATAHLRREPWKWTPGDAEYVQCGRCAARHHVAPLRKNGCVGYWLL